MTTPESDPPRGLSIPPKIKHAFSRKTLGADLSAGLVLGVESVPDGLASGLLAGVNPLAGLYAYLFGMVGAAAFTSSSFMAVQATGAMSLVVADAKLSSLADPDRALFTLAVMTGVAMIAAGLLKAGRLLRFVPTAVMTGFITAVGVNIVLGQLGNLTGYSASGDNRVIRTINLLLNFNQVSWPTFAVGVFTIIGIILLTRTPLKSLGLVVAIVLGSALAALFVEVFGLQVAQLRDIAEVPNGLPGFVLPQVGDIVYLLVPALSLAFVGLVQGAAVSGGVPNTNGKPANASRDFIGQGAGNVLSGLFQGMPVGGSMSASSLIFQAGAKTRLALFVAGGVMALTILLFSSVVGFVAMPALAALLIVIGVSTIKPAAVMSVIKTGPFQTAIMALTFVLTLIIPLQFAVLVGVAFGILMFVVDQSNRLTVRRLEFHGTDVRETDPPAQLAAADIVVLQPYGSLFFASAPVFEASLPTVTKDSSGSVVIIRLRGVDQLGLSLIEVLRRYAQQLIDVDSSMKVVISSDKVAMQLKEEGLELLLGDSGIYRGTEWLGAASRRAVADAETEIDARNGS